MMRIQRRTPSEAELAALADGILPPGRRTRVERQVAESPDLQGAMAAQRRVLSALAGVREDTAPASLRAELALAHPPRQERKRFAFAPGGLVAASIAAVLVAAVVLVISAGGSRVHPTIVEASLRAVLPPQASVGSPTGQSQTLPDVTVAGLTYPYLENQFGYEAVGVRHDLVGGRRATSVLYRRGASRVAYQIVSGPALKLGQPAGTITVNGVRFWTLHTAHGTVVTWVRSGHSCILVSRGTGVIAMLRLASWHEGGLVPY